MTTAHRATTESPAPDWMPEMLERAARRRAELAERAARRQATAQRRAHGLVERHAIRLARARARPPEGP
ncbi:hypothetical protein ACWT_1166 [Actinoplanes sp. SE50]|uniref:hypothetical protein n=1 Tax=unclassified Actinoplanes TaxID=2626549 RepID=UPI00023ED1A9|nr:MULTISPECIES: hypothetical protein [unclassified Actinoplanes]AEV82182.1 hypothetical protein ACPL_1285 [Actinoplanes sp. SE50/110]ATO80581.1 hypothetical protein ACWT_1166 [Actinoplanes sp. SE50]SLL97987.1 hypothetical protein ACSP50_1203 [Actinoplanes sp. SE50/110]